MSRSEKLILVKDEPSTLVAALDATLANQGYVRSATQTIREDFTPLLSEEGEPLAFVISEPHNEWVACWTSLAPEVEWDLAEAVAHQLERPLIYAIFAGESAVYVYRYWDAGALQAEALPDAEGQDELDEDALLAQLAEHGVPVELVDDRISGFDQEHLVLGYSMRRGEAETSLS